MVMGMVDAGGHKDDGYWLAGWMVVTEIDLVREMHVVCCNDGYWLQRWILITQMNGSYRDGYWLLDTEMDVADGCTTLIMNLMTLQLLNG